MPTVFKLTIHGNEVHVTPKLPDIAAEALSKKLSYQPKGGEHAENHVSNKWIFRKGEKPKFNPRATWDGSVSLFEKGRGKFNKFPLGVLPEALACLKAFELKTSMRFEVDSVEPVPAEDRDIEGKTVKLKGKKVKIKLREYQPVQIDEMVNAPFGRAMIESPTASGKSVTISGLIYKFPQAKILVTVPSLSLLYQTAETIEGLIGEKVGTFGDQKFDPKRVTVSTIQSLYRRRAKEEIIQWLSGIDIWIVDEAHMAASDQFKVISDLLVNTSRRYGVSATLRREGNDEMLFYALLGPLVHRTTADELIQKGYLAEPIIEMHVCEHNYVHNPKETGTKKPTFPDVERACITEAIYRQKLILDQVERVTQLGELPCIIMIGNYLELGDILHEQVAQFGKTAYLSGEDSLKIRDKVLQQVNKGEVPYLICSRIFDEGIDLPRVQSVILACAGTSGNKAAQRVGRGLRISPETGKTHCRIIDIDDREKYFLSKHSSTRRTWYELLFPGRVKTYRNGELEFQFGDIR